MLGIMAFSTTSAYAQINEETGSEKFIVLSSYTEKYLVDQSATITGKYFDRDNNRLDGLIELQVYDLRNSERAVLVYETNILAKNGTFQDRGFVPPETGRYSFVAKDVDGTNSSFNISVVDLAETFSFKIILVIAVCLSALLIMAGFINSHRIKIPTYHVIRFASISIIAMGMITTFLVLDVEYGKTSPFGIVLKEYVRSDNVDGISENPIADQFLKIDWIIHIGGIAYDNYSTGLEIPVFIVVLGVMGGYLRFFYYTANPWLKNAVMDEIKAAKNNTMNFHAEECCGSVPKFKEKSITNDDEKYDEIMDRANDGIFHQILSRTLINRIMSDLALLFIAPILAIMTNFVLLQGGLNIMDDLWTFAVTSFAAGLFTENVIKTIHNLVGNTPWVKREKE